jgi:hypothetical protein
MTQPAYRPQPGEVIAFPTLADARDDIQAPRDGTPMPHDERGDYCPDWLATVTLSQLRDEAIYLSAHIADCLEHDHAALMALAMTQLAAIEAAITLKELEAA